MDPIILQMRLNMLHLLSFYQTLEKAELLLGRSKFTTRIMFSFHLAIRIMPTWNDISLYVCTGKQK